MVDRGLALWAGRDAARPTFLYLHFMDAHMPRFLPEAEPRFPVPGYDWRARFRPDGEPDFDRARRSWDQFDASDFTPDDRRYFAAVYDTLVAYLDEHLGRLFTTLRRDDPTLSRTVILVVADHGEELGDDGRIDHGDSLADAVQHVPWIMAGGGIPPGQVVTRITENVDVMPTLLSYLHVPLPPGTHADGRPQLGADGTPCPGCAKAAAFYAWEDYRGIRRRRQMLRMNLPGSVRARCEGLVQGFALDRRSRRALPATADSIPALRQRLERRLGPLERRFLATRYGPANRAVLLRTEYWRLGGAPASGVLAAERGRPGLHLPDAGMAGRRPWHRTPRPRRRGGIARIRRPARWRLHDRAGHGAARARAVALRLRALAAGGIREGSARGVPPHRDGRCIGWPARRRRLARAGVELPDPRNACDAHGRRPAPGGSGSRRRGAASPARAGVRPVSEAARISVVIPTFDRAHLLSAVLDSVRAQRDCPPFEVIVVDDASTDATPDVLAARTEALRVVRLARNAGVARARQAGVEQARGALLAFHDSDDLMLPDRLGRLAGILDRHPDVDAVFANGLVDGDRAAAGATVVPDALARRLDGRRFGVREIVRDGLPVFLQASLIRRRAYDAAGGIDPTLVRHADLELVCRLALTGRVVFLDLPVFRYRLHGENQTRDRLKLRQGMVDVLRRLRERHPEALAELGPTWVRRRERRHLLRIAWRHWMAAWLQRRPREVVAAGAALRQVVALATTRVPRPPDAG